MSPTGSQTSLLKASGWAFSVLPGLCLTETAGHCVLNQYQLLNCKVALLFDTNVHFVIKKNIMLYFIISRIETVNSLGLCFQRAIIFGTKTLFCFCKPPPMILNEKPTRQPPIYSELMGQLINKQFEARWGLLISWEIKLFQSLEFVLYSFSL